VCGHEKLFARLAKSRFRSRFRLGEQERRYLEVNGLETVLAHARDFVDKRLANAAPAKDGKQTPMRGHPVFIAQHATATCCRRCLAKWHGIEAGKELSVEERAQVLSVIEAWLAASDPKFR
jgi:hypothetical protein